ADGAARSDVVGTSRCHHTGGRDSAGRAARSEWLSRAARPRRRPGRCDRNAPRELRRARASRRGGALDHRKSIHTRSSSTASRRDLRPFRPHGADRVAQEMIQIAQYQDGRMELQEAPAPTPPPGGVLVRLTHSVISAGTERMKVEQARMSLLQKARARPDQVRKVLEAARTLGWRSAFEKVRNRLEMPAPLGYSAAGIVERVDSGNTRFRAGDRVAVGGAECAFHAELVAVPDMLAVQIPDGVENWQAAYTTIASIALQAVRQLEPALGDRVLVVGQGLIGLLVTALLRASGARVLAIDVAPERIEQARAM